MVVVRRGREANLRILRRLYHGLERDVELVRRVGRRHQNFHIPADIHTDTTTTPRITAKNKYNKAGKRLKSDQGRLSEQAGLAIEGVRGYRRGVKTARVRKMS